MFKKATKKQAKLRCAVFGVSGSGKTYSALRIAKGMGGKIALIDTERGSASKYAGNFDFDVEDLENHTVESYVKVIKMAKGYDVLIIDSLTHAWQELLQQIDALAKAKYKGNSWSAWSEGTPQQKELVNALLSFPGHIIATMRCKTEWSQEKDERSGKLKPVRVGMSPEQGKGIEYEFDLLLEINEEHYATVIKDRTGKFQDKILHKPGEEFGEELIAWLNDGEKEPVKLDRLDEADEEYKSFTASLSEAKSMNELKDNFVKACQHFKNSDKYSKECIDIILKELTSVKDFAKQEFTKAA